jgi:hypothetical protein
MSDFAWLCSWAVARYALVRSFVEGFGTARDDDVLGEFQQWLSSQPQHRAISDFACSSLVTR